MSSSRLLALFMACLCCSFVRSVTPLSSGSRRYLSMQDGGRNFNTFVNVNSEFTAKTQLNHDKGYSLCNYMRLPVDQYVCIKMPLDSTLERMAGTIGDFELKVPPVTFFSLSVSPTVKCTVSQTHDSVIIESNEVILGGSPFVENLNGCYKIKIKTVFKWEDDEDRLSQSIKQSLSSSTGNGNGMPKLPKKQIYSKSAINVQVDPPPPFKYFGKRLLESTGTLAMGIALRQIENAFVTNLATDYNRWAVDGGYRELRDEKSCELALAEEKRKGSRSSSSSSRSSSSGSLGNDRGVEARAGSPPPVTTTSTSSSLPTELAPAPSLVTVDSSDSPDSPVKPSGSGTASPSSLSSSSSSSSSSFQVPFFSGIGGIGGRGGIGRGGEGDLDESPAVLLDDICLIPGVPLVRIEDAPNNARRIFTGVDISAGVSDVWDVLTDYANLGNVIPSLVKNEVVELREDGGARLAQIGGAKVLPGVTFTAKTVLDVNVYLEDGPIPDSMTADHLEGAPLSSATDSDMRKYARTLPLQRGIFPRPYAITSLPHRDITMQNVQGQGDFEHYQGIWRMQGLPNCAADGSDACRLTYAVELRPKGFLPVGLIEGRIAADLKDNLAAIRDFVEKRIEERETRESSESMFMTSRLIAQERGRKEKEKEKEAESKEQERVSVSISTDTEVDVDVQKEIEKENSRAGLKGRSKGKAGSGLDSDSGSLATGVRRVEATEAKLLEGVVSSARLAQIEQLVRQQEEQLALLKKLATAALKRGGSESNKSNRSKTNEVDGDGRNIGNTGNSAVTSDIDIISYNKEEGTGDIISPKRKSFRRWLVTGSSRRKEEDIERDRQILQLEKELQKSANLLERIDEIMK